MPLAIMREIDTEGDHELPDDFRCALSLERFREPVILVQSGQTYERSDLLLALAARPGVDPQTNVRFDGEPTFTGAPAGAFSLNWIYDHAAAEGRLFGLRYDNPWIDAGTPISR